MQKQPKKTPPTEPKKSPFQEPDWTKRVQPARPNGPPGGERPIKPARTK